MELDDSYKVVCGQILMTKPLPFVSTTYSLILQEQHQRGINTSTPLNAYIVVMHASVEIMCPRNLWIVIIVKSLVTLNNNVIV